MLAVFYSDTPRLSLLGYQSISQIAYLVNMSGMNNKNRKVQGEGNWLRLKWTIQVLRLQFKNKK